MHIANVKSTFAILHNSLLEFWQMVIEANYTTIITLSNASK